MNIELLFFLIMICLFPVTNGNAQDLLIPYRDGDKWGYADTSHNIVITPAFDKVITSGSRNGLFIVQNELKSGVVNLENELIVDTEFRWIGIHQKYIRAQTEYGFELYTHEGKPILEDQHYLDGGINDSLIIVGVTNEKVGLLQLDNNRPKRWLLDSIYSSLSYNHTKNEITGFRNDTSYLFALDGIKITKMNEVIGEKNLIKEEEPVFVDMSFEDGYVEKKNKRKFVPFFEYTLKRCNILDYQYLIVELTKISEYGKEILSRDTLETPYSTIKINSKPRIDGSRVRLRSLSEYERLLWENERKGFRSYAIVTDTIGLKGIVDGEGNYILDCEYEDIYSGGLRHATDSLKHFKTYVCSKNGKFGLVGKGNKTILDFEYEAIKRYNYDIHQGIVCVKNGKYGIVSLDREIIIPFEMDFIGKGQNGKSFLLEKNKKYGAFDGTNTCAPIYDSSAFTIKYFEKYPVLAFIKNREIIGYGDFQGREFYKDK